MNDIHRACIGTVGATLGWMGNMPINDILAGIASFGAIVMFGFAIYDRFWGRNRKKGGGE